jgi:hypothetical protein
VFERFRFTHEGYLGIGTAAPAYALDVVGTSQLSGNSVITGTLGVTGIATLADASVLASSAAPTADAQIANKKYVDDQGGGGTVTSVAIGGNDGIDVDSGSPITSAGTIQLGLSSIPVAKLASSSVSYGGVSVTLGSSDATPAFNLSDATAYTGDSSLVTLGTVGTGVWQGTEVGLGYGGTELVGETDGKIVIADGSGAPVHLDVGSSSGITILGTVGTGVWQGTEVGLAYGGTELVGEPTSR